MERCGAKPNFRLASYLLLRVSHRKLIYANLREFSKKISVNS